jgi:hypothetical protein
MHILSKSRENARLLRSSRERPRRRAANKRNDFAPM